MARLIVILLIVLSIYTKVQLFKCALTDTTSSETNEDMSETARFVNTLYERGNQKYLFNYIVNSLQKLKNEIDAIKQRHDIDLDDDQVDASQYEANDGALNNLKKTLLRYRNANDAGNFVKRSRKQLYSSGLQGVWAVPGKK